MTRLTPLFLASLMLLALAGPLGAATLKARVTVSGAFVTIGHLIDGAGDAAATPVFQSPDPGTEGLVNAEQIIAIAQQNGVIDIDALGIDQVAVARASRVISREEMRATIATALADYTSGIDADRLALRFDDPIADLHVEDEITAPLHVVVQDYRSGSNRFKVVIGVPGSRVFAAGETINGYATPLAPVVTVNRRIGRGDEITAQDLAIELVPANRIPDNAARATETVIGKAANRSLSAGSSINLADLTEPTLVQRNESVTILFRRGALLLTARGKALASGPKGTVIRVINDYTRRMLEAEIVAAGTVELLPAPAAFAALASE